MNLDRWLTSKRLRAHGLLLGLTIWTFYIWTIATPTLRDRNGNLKGTDFLHFYTLGSLAIARQGGELYNLKAQAAMAAQRMPDAAGIRYLPLYPPQVSLIFAPLAYLSYGRALALWWLCTAVIYGACCYLIWRVSPNLRDFGGTVALVAIAFPAFFHLIAWGQTSALALACFTAGFLLLRGKREFVAGLALGCLVFKPQLGLAAAVVFIVSRRWRVIAGATLSAAAQIGVGIAYYGVDPFLSWLRMLGTVPALLPSFEPRPYQTHCLRTFWSMLVPWSGAAFGLYVVSAIVALAGTAVIWKCEESLSLKYSALLLATVLVSPHLTIYDLVILAPAILLLTDWLISHPSAPQGTGILIYLVCALPLVGPCTRWTHIQLSVIVMAALLYWLWRMRESGDSLHPSGAHENGKEIRIGLTGTCPRG
jgi:alpha-1,2-mannosyltransferase